MIEVHLHHFMSPSGNVYYKMVYKGGVGRLKIAKNKRILCGIKRSVLLNMRVLLDENEGARRWVEVELHE